MTWTGRTGGGWGADGRTVAGGRTGGGRADRRTWGKGEVDGQTGDGQMSGRADGAENGGRRADESGRGADMAD